MLSPDRLDSLVRALDTPGLVTQLMHAQPEDEAPSIAGATLLSAPSFFARLEPKLTCVAAWADGDRAIVKLAADPKLIEREALMLRVLRAADPRNFCVPRVFAGPSLTEPAWMVTSYDPGVSIGEVLTVPLAMRIALGLAELHCVETCAENFAPTQVPPAKTILRAQRAREQAVLHAGACAVHDKATSDLFAACSRLLDREQDETSVGFVHNDFHVDNLLWAAGCGESRLTIIDWEFASLGSPWGDVARLVATGPLSSGLDAERSAFLAVYAQERLDRGPAIDARSLRRRIGLSLVVEAARAAAAAERLGGIDVATDLRADPWVSEALGST